MASAKGRIGREIADRAGAFKMRVAYTGRTPRMCPSSTFRTWPPTERTLPGTLRLQPAKHGAEHRVGARRASWSTKVLVAERRPKHPLPDERSQLVT